MSANPLELRGEVRNLRDLGTRLPDLWAAHPDWVMDGQWAETIYCLPPPAIDILAIRHPTRGPLLNKRQAAIEREFTEACSDFSAIGTLAGAYIIGTPLDPRPTPLDRRWLAELARTPAFAWIRAAARDFHRLSETTDPVADRVKGYAGWLLTEPAFLKDVGRLRTLAESLPPGFRPSFPLLRPGPVAQHKRATFLNPRRSGVRAQQFGEAVCRLFDRWGLTCMAAWDLPVPQGPLLPNPLPPNCPAQPRTGIHMFVPPFYPIPGTDDLAGEILRIQRQAARDLGVDDSAVGLPRHQAYARLLDVLHLERSILARFPGPRPPRGLVDVIITAIAKTLDMSRSRVDKYLDAIRRCRRGDRAGVAILRVTPRARRSSA